jgi:hypothetical protein
MQLSNYIVGTAMMERKEPCSKMNRRDFIKIIAAAAVGGAAIYEGLDNFGAQAAVEDRRRCRPNTGEWSLM